MEVLNPFEIFPKEIWEIILDKVEHSKDIQSLLREFPQLDISIDSKRKRFWYLDQVLAFVCEWVTEKDILNLRLVCKKWQAKVDYFLQNQPLARAYSHELHKDNVNFWRHIYNNDLQLIDTGCDISMCLRLLLTDEVLKHPQHRNPFVFRQLRIFFEDAEVNRTLDSYLLRISNFLRHSGGHLWFLQLHFEDMLESVNVSTPMQITVQLMNFVPNLKCLHIAGQEVEEDYSEEASSICDIEEAKKLESNLPELPFLESIEICDWFVTFNDPFWPLLFKKYGSQVRRLEMGLQEWNPCGNFFPSLTELQLGGYYHNLAEITKTLASFASANIVKVVLSFGSQSKVQISVEQSLLKWLELFPNIKYFAITNFPDFGKADLKEEGTSHPERDSIPSLQNFEVIDCPDLSYNFLRCFPSLRRLVIHRRDFVNFDFSTPDSPVKLREQIQTRKIYESNVWEHLGMLKTVKMFSMDNVYDFHKETFEKIKNAKKNIME